MTGPDELDLAPGTVFLGDLHVDTDDETALASFERVLAGLGNAPRVVFVGDLFEFWTGSAQAGTAGGRRALAAMARLAGSGTALEVVPGNRDFLLGSTFASKSGARLHPDGVLARLPAGERVLVIHGDELCTADVAYHRFRRVMRSRLVGALASRMPRAVGSWVARRLRAASRRSVAAKPPERTRQQPDEVLRLARRAGANTLLCGHAHRFRDERIDGVRWIVLDAWGDERDLLVVGVDGALVPARSADLPVATLSR